MKLSHCVTALLVSVVVLLAGNLLSAPYSADSYEALVRQKERIETNLVALQMKNDELQGRIERLRRDPDAVRVEARALGYYGAGESVVRLDEPNARTMLQSPGTIIRVSGNEADSRHTVRLVALLAGLSVLFSLVIGTAAGSHREIRRASR